MDGTAPFCGPGSRQFPGLFEFVVRTRSTSSCRARYGSVVVINGASILRADRRRRALSPYRTVPRCPPSRPAARRGNDNHVAAPMPGLASTVSIQPGQSVKVGDVLMILEAMKMETVLYAVARRHCRQHPRRRRRPSRFQRSAH
ncbi:biotin/lipoyl-containing protein [Afipia massiliensis]|uniref:biotin/lipoyl-containing protein n=1 Tax=Afipia massiliensis TaxID=211460 RepID=UPI003D9B4B10